MRKVILRTMPVLIATVAFGVSGAQGITFGAAKPDSVPLRRIETHAYQMHVRALGWSAIPAIMAQRVVYTDTVQGNACPMPVQRPDSSHVYIGLRQPARSGDGMPTQAPTCVNPLDRHR
ncbi:MAG: hypothetical protein ABJE47_06860 [bacterium]